MSVHNLLRESVLLTLIKGNDRIDRSAIITAHGELIPVSDIDSLGNLGNLSEWYVILKSTNSRQELLKNDELKGGDQVFIISEPYKHVKLVRLLNVPPSVTDEDIKSIAAQWGGVVLSVDHERLPRPFETIKTFVRRVRIRFSSRQDEDKVPVTIRFGGFNVSVQLEGRQKVCYRCKQVGHIKAECTTVKCRKCYELGHDDPNCQRKRSYATAAVSTPIVIDPTPSQVEQNHVTSEPAPIQHKENQSLGLVQRPPYCRKCKKTGHKRKDCLQQDNTSNKSSQIVENQADLNDDINEITPTTNITSHIGCDAMPPVVIPAEKHLETTQQKVNLFMNNIATLQHQIMSEAYNDVNGELKRTNADRSIDSDLDIDPKKPHTYDSSPSTLDEDEDEDEDQDGEVVEQ